MAVFIFGTLAVLVKQNVLPFVWIIFAKRWGTRRGTLYMTALVAIWIASFIPYLPEGADRILDRVFIYSAGGATGFSFLPLRLVSYIAIALFPFWYRRGDLPLRMFVAALILHLGMPIATWNHIAIVPIMALAAGRIRWSLGFSVAWWLMMFFASEGGGMYILSCLLAWLISALTLLRIIMSYRLRAN